VERSFSVNKECLIENLQEHSLIGQRIVYDAVKENYKFDLEKLSASIDKSMISYVKAASSKRKEYLKRKKNDEDVEELEKKKMKHELAILQAQKEKKEEETAMINDNIKYLQRKLL
jgi:hypothetical protein